MHLLDFQRDGAEHRAGLIDAQTLQALDDELSDLAPDIAGTRLFDRPGLAQWLRPESAIGRTASAMVAKRAFPVRMILFDKTATTNWSLGWHQDRTIAVRERHDVAGFGPWTRKGGVDHVAPPIEILSKMVTVRVHLDPVDDCNAPLLIARGSHRLGMIAEADIDAILARSNLFSYLANRGDVWFYSTPILHASKTAAVPAKRRVLQVDYAGDPLPAPFEWLGIGTNDDDRP